MRTVKLMLTGLALCGAIALTAQAQPAATAAELQLPEGAQKVAAAISEADIENWVRELSADEMEGRAPGTAGDKRAQQMLIREMQRLGLKPGAAKNEWLQHFALVGISADVPAQWRFQKRGENGGEITLARGADFIAASGVQLEAAAVKNAELVFVGYGIQAPEFNWDDYKGADLKGKVLVMLNNDPHWNPQLFAGETRLYYGRWTYKYESAAAQGAVGAIIIHTDESAGYPWQVVETSWSGTQYELPAEGEARAQVNAWVTQKAAQQLLQLGGYSLEALQSAARERKFQPRPLGITTEIAFNNKIERTQSANVLGLIEGGDPQLKKEVVIYSAHFDHLGIKESAAAGADNIYNGALDNAAGVARVLAAAKAMQALPKPPRRSVLFAFVGAEEQGLLGSAYYAANPTFAPGRIAANVNLDGGNPWGVTEDVAYIGLGKSSLDAIAIAAAKLQGRTVKGDQFPSRGFFYRSDQFSFAKIGVPAFYLKAGNSHPGRPANWGRKQREQWTEKHYHQTSDEVEANWQWDGMAQDAALAFYCGLAVAEQSALPAWEAGDEFEAARQQALDALATTAAAAG